MSREELLIWIKGYVAACGGWLDEEETEDLITGLEEIVHGETTITITMLDNASCTGNWHQCPRTACTCRIETHDVQ